jgi:adenylate cyclase
LQEEIHLERALRRLGVASTDDFLFDAELARFQEFESHVRQELEIAASIIESTLADPRWLSPRDAIEFGRIALLLENIQKEHAEVNAHAHSIVARIQTQDLIDLEADILALEAEADHLDEELFTLLSSLETLNITQAEEIEAAETMIMGIYMQNFILTFVVFFLGIVISATITTRLVNPVRDLKSKSEEITRGNLNVEVEPRTEDEVGQLATTFNHMARELRLNHEVKELFGKYVDPRIVDSLLSQSPELNSFAGNKQEMTVFFSDVKGFSAMSELLTPVGLVRLINRYFSIMSEPIISERGVIDKYVGDCIMAFWGPPFTGEDNHAALACEAALAQYEQLNKLKSALPEILGFRKGLPDIQVRVGLATGDVLSGNIGSDNVKSYTVMGDTVNIASRLESLNKQYRTRILINELTRTKIGDRFAVREIDSVTVAGKDESTTIFELFAHADSIEPQLLELFQTYESGLKYYRETNWDMAEQQFKACLNSNPDDGPAQLMLDRIKELRSNPPQKDWDGVWNFTVK